MLKKISVVIPFFNEENEIEELIKDIINVEKKTDIYGEYIFICDASTDNSLFIVNNILKKNIELKKKSNVILNSSNLGWSKSLIKGIKLCNHDFFIFLPGDNEVPISSISHILKFEYDILILERYNMFSRPIFRIILSYIYRYIVCLSFLIKPMDLNGVFLMKTSRFKDLNLNSSSFFISAEIILKSIYSKYSHNTIKAIKLKKKKFYQSSSLSLKQFKIVTLEFLKCFKQLIIHGKV